MKNKTRIIILAGGKGVRMGGDLPKVLAQVRGKPMIKYVMEAVDASSIDDRPVVVVGYKKELVMDALGDKYQYIYQEHQFGTGHAVKSTKEYLKNKAEHIIVLYGDMPFISAETIKKINETHIKSDKKITMATVVVHDFRDWRTNFWHFSRIIKDENGKIIRDVQFKDATEEEKEITEVNPSYYCFDAQWMWEKLETLDNNNAQKEYYLTDLIKMAMENGVGIESIEIKPKEALGANSKEELDVLERLAPKNLI